MTAITDDYMKQMLGTTKNYTVVILKKGPAYKMPGVNPIIWEHGRRNFSLRADGLLSVVLPIAGESEMGGIGVFNTDAEQTKKLMEEDPAIKANVLVYEIYSARSFPGDSLP